MDWSVDPIQIPFEEEEVDEEQLQEMEVEKEDQTTDLEKDKDKRDKLAVIAHLSNEARIALTRRVKDEPEVKVAFSACIRDLDKKTLLDLGEAALRYPRDIPLCFDRNGAVRRWIGEPPPPPQTRGPIQQQQQQQPYFLYSHPPPQPTHATHQLGPGPHGQQAKQYTSQHHFQHQQQHVLPPPPTYQQQTGERLAVIAVEACFTLVMNMPCRFDSLPSN